jgi:hypothetical protein
VSVRIPVVECGKCSFSTGLGARPNEIRLYRLRDGITTEISHRSEWCHQCEMFTVTESLPDVETARADALEAAKRSRAHSAIGPMSILRRLTPSFKSRGVAYRSEMVRAEALYSVISTRTAPPKCLQCGSTNHELLALPPCSPRAKVTTEVAHPGCGGMFVIDDTSDTRFSLAGVVYYHDSEGNLTEKSEDDYDSYHRAWLQRLQFSTSS